jgi:hypothetical protein
MKIGRKSVPDSLGFSEHLLEARGERAGHSDRAVGQWVDHKSENQSPASTQFGKSDTFDFI